MGVGSVDFDLASPNSVASKLQIACRVHEEGIDGLSLNESRSQHSTMPNNYNY